jgi:hypothetical protein
MDNKYIQAALTVVFAYLGSLPISRLVGSLILKIFRRSPIVDATIFITSFGMGVLCIWFLFNKWHTRFWLKIVCASFVITIALIAIRMYDMSMLSASNFRDS